MSKRVVIVGGGYIGMYTAQRLQRRLSAIDAEITVIDPQPNMTYQPFLPEVAAGNIEPRHVVVPLRTVLRRCRVVTAEFTSISHQRRTLSVRPASGSPYDIAYDIAVVCPGSVSRVVPIPGLRENSLGIKTIGEAIRLRNHVLSRLDAAASEPDPDVRRRALTFVFVGAGYAGVEAIAELADMARHALAVADRSAPRRGDPNQVPSGSDRRRHRGRPRRRRLRCSPGPEQHGSRRTMQPERPARGAPSQDAR